MYIYSYIFCVAASDRFFGTFSLMRATRTPSEVFFLFFFSPSCPHPSAVALIIDTHRSQRGIHVTHARGAKAISTPETRAHFDASLARAATIYIYKKIYGEGMRRREYKKLLYTHWPSRDESLLRPFQFAATSRCGAQKLLVAIFYFLSLNIYFIFKSKYMYNLRDIDGFE